MYRVVRARFERPTINIGVGGAARVGKSTLLQSLTGLADDQMPTGSGIPVTAVRSRIFHSPRKGRAVIQLHTAQSFLDDVVGRSHAKLLIAGRPSSLADFRNWKYADSAPGEVEHRRRLEDMQRSLDSYAAKLTGAELIPDDLSGLRPWVAYPTNDEIKAAEPDGRPVRRQYLAVRVDLPGLGEIDPDAEQRHVSGLRNEVDVVLVVKRTVEAMTDEARGFVTDRRDFIPLVVNAGAGDDQNLVATPIDDIRRQVNNGEDGRYLTRSTASTQRRRSVTADLRDGPAGAGRRRRSRNHSGEPGEHGR